MVALPQILEWYSGINELCMVQYVPFCHNSAHKTRVALIHNLIIHPINRGREKSYPR